MTREHPRPHRLTFGDVALDQRLQQVLRAGIQHELPLAISYLTVATALVARAHSRRRASASLDLRRESLHRALASCADSQWPSIPAPRGPSPAARVTTPRRELRPLRVSERRSCERGGPTSHPDGRPHRRFAYGLI